MTFNIRYGFANDGENRWELRKDLVTDVISQNAPDVLGVQEAMRFQLDHIHNRLPEYSEVGISRDGGSEGEYSAILYLKSRFDVDSSGTFWLSETPAEPSTHWGNQYLRICTWARFIDKESNKAFYIYNTHLDHESQQAREKGAELIMRTISERTHSNPFMLMGDLNASESNSAIKYLKGNEKLSRHTPIPLIDSWRVVHPDETVAGTFNSFTGAENGPKIDYIFVTPETIVSDADIVKTNRDGRYPSDHYPVTAVISLTADRAASESDNSSEKQ